MFDDSEIPSWGSLLGDYFHVASTIAAMETAFDEPELEQNETYHDLLEGRQELREQLEEVSRRYVDSGLNAALNAAFDDRGNEPD